MKIIYTISKFILIIIICNSCSNYTNNNQRNPILVNCRKDSKSVVINNNYSDQTIIKHDVSVTLWFVEQTFAMEYISCDNQGNVRLRSYKQFTKFEDKAEDVLEMQKIALDEFITSYQGQDKENLLKKWFDCQTNALNILAKFLKSIQLDMDTKSILANDNNQYERVIKIQRLYQVGFEKYRQNWKDFQKSGQSQ
jgi:hypothetical protein